MSDAPRLLAIMGSGETSPSMVRVHRALLRRLGPPPVPAVFLDTPAAFQENVGALGERVADYFRLRLQQAITPLALGGDVARPGPAGAEALARLVAARYVFAGPGSPSYALAQWSGTPLPDLLAEKLALGGALVFASAAALTLGVATLPVYEIYKVGQAPHWLPGLDLLAALGLRAAVLPHYDNRDGGDHDTRCCFIGERRLALLEARLPAGAFVLGVDEHSAVVFDLGAGELEVSGRGGLTVRAGGAQAVLPAGSRLPIPELGATAARLAAGGAAAARTMGEGGADGGAAAIGTADIGTAAIGTADIGTADIGTAAARLARAFEDRLERRDPAGAAQLALALEAALERPAEGEGGALARAHLQAMLVRLGETAAAGGADRRALLAPLVEALLASRERARAAGQWALADLLRDDLDRAGIAVRDTPAGPEWSTAAR